MVGDWLSSMNGPSSPNIGPASDSSKANHQTPASSPKREALQRRRSESLIRRSNRAGTAQAAIEIVQMFWHCCMRARQYQVDVGKLTSVLERGLPLRA